MQSASQSNPLLGLAGQGSGVKTSSVSSSGSPSEASGVTADALSENGNKGLDFKVFFDSAGSSLEGSDEQFKAWGTPLSGTLGEPPQSPDLAVPVGEITLQFEASGGPQGGVALPVTAGEDGNGLPLAGPEEHTESLNTVTSRVPGAADADYGKALGLIGQEDDSVASLVPATKSAADAVGVAAGQSASLLGRSVSDAVKAGDGGGAVTIGPTVAEVASTSGVTGELVAETVEGKLSITSLTAESLASHPPDVSTASSSIAPPAEPSVADTLVAGGGTDGKQTHVTAPLSALPGSTVSDKESLARVTPTPFSNPANSAAGELADEPIAAQAKLAEAAKDSVQESASRGERPVAELARQVTPKPELAVKEAVVATVVGETATDAETLLTRAVSSTSSSATSTPTQSHSFSQVYRGGADSVVQTAVGIEVGRPGWGEKVVERVMWLSAQGLQRAEIQLDPPELGPMQVRISSQQDQTSVVFSSQQASVREALDQSMGRLREMMDRQGLALVDSEVSDQSLFGGSQEQQLAEGQGGEEGSTLGAGLSAGETGEAAGNGAETVTVRVPLGLVDDYA